MSCVPSLALSAPRIAVIVPAYGVAALVHEAVESLLAQTFTDWECVIVDDGAPDDVAGAVMPFLSDRRIRLLETENHGVSAARNHAIANCQAPYVALLDGDDLLRPAYLARMVAALDAEDQARLVTCNARIFGALARERLCVTTRQGTSDGAHGSLGDILDRSFNVYIGSAFRRADWAAVGGFDTAMTHSEDFDFWVRLVMRGGYARYIDAVLGEYRIRPGSASASGAKMIRGNLRVYEKALATLGEGPEAGICHQMIAHNHALLAFEEALMQVSEGDVARGLPALRKAHRGQGGIMWNGAFLLWRVAPSLAPAMLRWRRRRNARGNSVAAVAPLGVNEGVSA